MPENMILSSYRFAKKEEKMESYVESEIFLHSARGVWVWPDQHSTSSSYVRPKRLQDPLEISLVQGVTVNTAHLTPIEMFLQTAGRCQAMSHSGTEHRRSPMLSVLQFPKSMRCLMVGGETFTRTCFQNVNVKRIPKISQKLYPSTGQQKQQYLCQPCTWMPPPPAMLARFSPTSVRPCLVFR